MAFVIIRTSCINIRRVYTYLFLSQAFPQLGLNLNIYEFSMIYKRKEKEQSIILPVLKMPSQ